MDFNQILHISEIFYSIQGESNDAGYPCIFIRLSGCDLRCSWCDTEYSYSKGEALSLDFILKKVHSFGISRVEITGGEPLLQEPVFSLMEILLQENYRVLLETGGHRDLSKVPFLVVKIMDVKCPDSLMSKKTFWKNLQNMDPKKDLLKFVLASKRDYEYAKDVIQNRKIPLEMVHFAVVTTQITSHQVATWMLEDQLEVKLQLQIHKMLDLP